ncbi:sialidase family protein [Paenibacillus sp. ATY16]|uniref:sialidase family protein n=1 Tax=Paenibacillus sp. ATY16 TaxID=1759312 RepID=UPI00200FA572|nr:sialidase family protein [Paenibacillus sp. ATY16]MCK9862883.1 glycoside hydrolase [Paenibacillus sp. ATY16]
MANQQITPSGPQQEPSIALNNLDQSTILVTTNDLRSGNNMTTVYRSINAGVSYAQTLLSPPPGFDASGDGIAAFGYAQTFLVAATALTVNPVQNSSIIVYRSTDNGATFSTPIIVNQGYGTAVYNDKPALMIDTANGSPYLGQAYIAYTRYFNNFTQSETLFQRSLDQGQTWSPPILLTNQVQGVTSFGSTITIGPQGDVYVGWMQYGPGTPEFLMRRSLDGGVTFGPIVVVSAVNLVPTPLPVLTFGFRVLTIAYMATDISPFNGQGIVYAVWQDNRTGSAHIFMSRSTDRGNTWSAPKQIDDSPAGTQNFLPNATVSRDTGAFKAMYYTNRVTSNLIDVFLAESNDAGNTFLPNRRITSASFNPNADPSLGLPTPSIGDYNDLEINAAGTTFVVWMDTRTGSQNIFEDR